MKLVTRAIVLALLLATAAIAPVQAAPDPTSVYNKVAQSDDPAAAADKLSGAEKKALKIYLTPVETTITPIEPEATKGLMALVSSCKETGHAVGKYNVFNVLLWTWELYAEVCYDGSRITYSYHRHKGVTNVAFWSWRTVDSHKSINTVLNPDRLTVYGQGEFKLCVFSNIGCVQYSYPWNELRFNANGSYSFRWG